jgi:hypothetical protein
MILLISASEEARISGMSLQHQAITFFIPFLFAYIHCMGGFFVTIPNNHTLYID